MIDGNSFASCELQRNLATTVKPGQLSAAGFFDGPVYLLLPEYDGERLVSDELISAEDGEPC